jgi:hypothetical protein
MLSASCSSESRPSSPETAIAPTEFFDSIFMQPPPQVDLRNLYSIFPIDTTNGMSYPPSSLLVSDDGAIANNQPLSSWNTGSFPILSPPAYNYGFPPSSYPSATFDLFGLFGESQMPLSTPLQIDSGLD